MPAIDLQRYRDRIQTVRPIDVCGKVADVVGLTVEATGPAMRIGDLCYIRPQDGSDPIPVEVVGFRGKRIVLMPLGEMTGIAPGSVLVPMHRPQMVGVSEDLLGRVIDSMGNPLDGGPPPLASDHVPLTTAPPKPLERRRITDPLATGIRALDACVTCGKGQRMGIMSGSGVGKSKLIGMVARNTNADVNVIALIGERGREVREFIENDLGPEGLARSVVVVVTSDRPALLRLKGAYVATAIAEWFRARGSDVMFMMDSITRFAMAQREVGLAVGEPPTTKGYPPSVYALLPKLLERAGTCAKGSITGFYAVLVEADDLNDPIGDAVRSILDGHVSLSRALATRNHYPAIDVLESVSRCMIDVTGDRHQELAADVRTNLAVYREAEDLVNIGAYVQGSNTEIDRAIELMPNLQALLRQGLHEASPFDRIEDLMAAALGR
ncbi:MAG: FliI/YscN family ATPase [bacterium]|nr:FliI/YscN family ATPase [bacterium]